MTDRTARQQEWTPLARWRAGLDILAIVMIIAVCATFLWRSWATPATTKSVGAGKAAVPGVPSVPVSIEGASLKGNPSSPAVLVIFSDFECPFCAKFARGAWPELERSYVQPGKLLVAFRHLPLSTHPWAAQAAAAAECAGQQGRFWQMHDLLFADQAHLDYSALRLRAKVLSLDEPIFDRCLSGSGATRAQTDLKEAALLKITGTPTFLVGTRQADGRVEVGKRLSGSGLEALKEAIDVAIVGGHTR